MIRALISGNLYGDPQARTSQAGKQFVTAKVRADGKDGASVWCSIIAFGEQADRQLTAHRQGGAECQGGQTGSRHQHGHDQRAPPPAAVSPSLASGIAAK
jgi:hypothetical protein